MGKFQSLVVFRIFFPCLPHLRPPSLAHGGGGGGSTISGGASGGGGGASRDVITVQWHLVFIPEVHGGPAPTSYK